MTHDWHVDLAQELFDEAEKYLKCSASFGYTKAVNRLDKQPIFRRGFNGRMRRHKDS